MTRSSSVITRKPLTPGWANNHSTCKNLPCDPSSLFPLSKKRKGTGQKQTNKQTTAKAKHHVQPRESLHPVLPSHAIGLVFGVSITSVPSAINPTFVLQNKKVKKERNQGKRSEIKHLQEHKDRDGRTAVMVSLLFALWNSATKMGLSPSCSISDRKGTLSPLKLRGNKEEWVNIKTLTQTETTCVCVCLWKWQIESTSFTPGETQLPSRGKHAHGT